DTRGRMAHLADGLVDLVPRQLAAFAGLRALRHLDLDVVRIDQVFGGHTEPAAGNLLDPAAHRIAVGQRLEAVRFLTALTGVRAPADAVHGDGERGMRLAADRTEAHRARDEALDDLLGRLDFGQVERLFGLLQLHHAADRPTP